METCFPKFCFFECFLVLVNDDDDDDDDDDELHIFS